MKHITALLIAIFLSSFSFNVISAVSIVECKDADGNHSFHKVCPPGSSQIGERSIKLRTNSDNKTSNKNIQATLYLIPECEACDEIKEFLGSRNITITEKNVNENINLQTELTDLTGSLKVPTTVIGSEVLIGYNRSKFINALKEVGYNEDS